MKHAIITLAFIVCEAAYFLIVFGIPWYIFRQPSVSGDKMDTFPKRFVKSVFVVWGVLVLFHFIVGREIAWAHAQDKGDLMHDGVAENGGILLLGWAIGALGAALSGLLLTLVSSIKARRAKSFGARVSDPQQYP